MGEWQKYNDQLKEAIEQPTKKQMLQMDELHLTLFELNQEKIALSESLKEINEKLDRYYKKINDLLNSDDPPNWAWRWEFKKTNVKWKEEFIKRLGKAEANKILSTAKQKGYPKIGVRFIDPNPDHIPETPIDKAKRNVKRLDLPLPETSSLADRLARLKGS